MTADHGKLALILLILLVMVTAGVGGVMEALDGQTLCGEPDC